jgi:hypothetical protein
LLLRFLNEVWKKTFEVGAPGPMWKFYSILHCNKFNWWSQRLLISEWPLFNEGMTSFDRNAFPISFIPLSCNKHSVSHINWTHYLTHIRCCGAFSIKYLSIHPAIKKRRKLSSEPYKKKKQQLNPILILFSSIYVFWLFIVVLLHTLCLMMSFESRAWASSNHLHFTHIIP